MYLLRKYCIAFIPSLLKMKVSGKKEKSVFIWSLFNDCYENGINDMCVYTDSLKCIAFIPCLLKIKFAFENLKIECISRPLFRYYNEHGINGMCIYLGILKDLPLFRLC